MDHTFAPRPRADTECNLSRGALSVQVRLVLDKSWQRHINAQFGALAEEFGGLRGRLRAAEEGHSGLAEGVSALSNELAAIADRLDEVKNAPAGSALYDRKFHSYRAEVAEFGCGRPHPGRGRDLLAARARARNARGTRGKEG